MYPEQAKTFVKNASLSMRNSIEVIEDFLPSNVSPCNQLEFYLTVGGGRCVLRRRILFLANAS